jgi:shikimate kinase
MRRRVLITGLSGVGKSTVIAALAEAGFHAVDSDEDGWSGYDASGEWVWDLPRIRSLLELPEELIFLSGTAENMRALLDRFDHIVLLSAPVEVMAERLISRTTNPYGRDAAERAEALSYKETVEPLLRRIATVEVDTTAPVDRVVQQVLRHIAQGTGPKT